MNRVTVWAGVFLFLSLFVCSLDAQEHDVWFGTSKNNAGQPSGIWHALLDQRCLR